MKTNDTLENGSPAQDLVLTTEAQHFLRGAGKWAGFLGIIGFIGSAFILVSAIFVGNISEIIAKLKPTSSPASNMGGVVSLLYVIVAVFYFLLSLNLFQFGSKVKTGLLFANTAQLTGALKKLRSFFLLWSIATIIIIIIFILIIVAAVVFSIGWQM